MFNLWFKKIKNIFNFRISERLRSDRSNGWIFVFVLFVIVNLIVVIFSTSLYFRIGKGEAFVVNDKTESGDNFIRINREDLDAIIYDFLSKEETFKKIKNREGLNIVDPSI